ncbi:alpha/beta fold hydrolase [Hoeflea sp. CAU 1731]
MLHGVGSSADTWRRLLPYLHTGTIIAPDYRGHGYSDSPEPPYCLEDFVCDIRRLLDELEIERIDVLGFSIGALFAAKLALNHPSCVKSLILLNSIADRTPEQKIRARERLEFLSTHLPDETAPATAVRWFTPAFLESHDDLVEAEAGITVSTPHAPYASSYRVLVENDLIDEVSGISCPTLIMTGELDEGSTPAMSEALHRQIPGSLLRIIGGVKHYMHFERPEELARHVNEFLKQADTAAVEM